MAKVTSVNSVSVQFADIRAWFEENMAVDKIDLNDQKVYEYVYEGARWGGVFQCTSAGAQRLFKKAKPKSILDIAMLTSIYRPGPLAANVDKLYLEAKNEGKQYDWGDTRINELLKETYGLLIFQEGVMMLAEKVAGFPKDKCDDVRRAIMKRSISGGDAAKAKVDEMKSEFVAGAVKNGYAEKVASDLYEKIAYFSGYAFNASHATAYAIDSYYCAWLLTHHEEEWLCAYLESMSNTPENKAEAFGYVKALGYQIVPIDINHASVGWTSLPGKKLMPNLTSVKGVGASAVYEIMENRPFKNVEELLWNDDGSWRHSKFNRKSLDALIKIGAFNSLDCVGEGKQFNSYHHMHEVIIENQDLVKKSPKRDPLLGKKNFYELSRKLAPEVQEWSRKELAQHKIDCFGTLDVVSMIEPAVLDRLDAKGIKSIDEWDCKGIYWMCISEYAERKTKNNKKYLDMRVVGPLGKSFKMKVWGYDGARQFSPYALVVAEVDRNEYGSATTMWKMKEIS